MENFRIDFTLSDPFPDGKKLGECGEKNAAQLIITPPENLASREEIRSYVVAFSTDRGPVRYGPVPKAETITVPVGNALTVGCALSVQLEGYDSDGEFIIKSPVLSGIMLSGSVAEGNCGGDDKNYIPGHIHNNLEILENLSESDGILFYKNSEINKSETVQTVELRASESSFSITVGLPVYGSMIFMVHNDENGNPYIPEGVEIISVEFNLESETEPVWIDIRDMCGNEPFVPYIINQHRAVYSDFISGTIVSQVTFVNNEVNTYYEAAESYLFNSLRVKYIDKDGNE